jgi:signal transduction histidine kinase
MTNESTGSRRRSLGNSARSSAGHVAASPEAWPGPPEANRRMNMVATLTAGVLRDLRGPLTYLLANLEYLDAQLATHEDDLPPGRTNELRQCLREAVLGATRVKDLVRDAAGLEPDADHGEHADLRAVLLSCIKVARTEIDHRARVVTEFDRVAPVRGSESRLSRLFLNLLMNAAQAVVGDAENEPQIRVVTRKEPDHRVTVEISDSGPGIPEDQIGRIFDPYFTTKPAGEGVGLGLTVCRYIVEDLGGTITVDSPPGRGTTFRVTLPAAEPASQRFAREPEARFSPSKPPVRSLPRRHLR